MHRAARRGASRAPPPRPPAARRSPAPAGRARRPAPGAQRPRISARGSGFFLLGIIEEPVLQASSRATQPKAGLDHHTSSSASRLRWTMHRAAAASDSTTKSRSLTASSELAVTPANPSSAAVASRSSPKPRPARAPAPPPQREPRVQRDLVVGRAARVELRGHRSQPLPQGRLEVEMDILERRIPGEPARRDLGRQGLQPAHELGLLDGRDQPGARQPVHVRDRAPQVVGGGGGGGRAPPFLSHPTQKPPPPPSRGGPPPRHGPRSPDRRRGARR